MKCFSGQVTQLFLHLLIYDVQQEFFMCIYIVILLLQVNAQSIDSSGNSEIRNYCDIPATNIELKFEEVKKSAVGQA